MTVRHLVLIGMMGSGKSTVGRACAQELGYPFIDTDEFVVAQNAMTVAEMFEQFGESGFRAREAVAVADAALAPTPTVIACGGGVVLDPANRAVLRANGVVVWLDADVEVLVRRVGDGRGRPLLSNGDIGTTLSRLCTLRGPSYEAAAQIRIDTSEFTRDATVAEVIRSFEHEVSNAG